MKTYKSTTPTREQDVDKKWYIVDASNLVLGRLATYSGKVVKWDEAVAKGTTEVPETLAWDATAPVQKLEDGTYPIPKPGEFKPY